MTTILAHLAAAILYVCVGWWAARDDMPLPLVVAVVVCGVVIAATIVCGGAL